MTISSAHSASSTNSDPVLSQPFALSATDYVRRAGLQWLARWWWAWVLPLAVFVVASFFDIVWLFVVFMLLCLLYPGLVMFLYYHYALSAEARASILEHTVRLDADGLSLHLSDARYSTHYLLGQISGFSESAKYLIVYLGRKRKTHIAIPRTALPDGADLRFVQLLEALRPDLFQVE